MVMELSELYSQIANRDKRIAELYKRIAEQDLEINRLMTSRKEELSNEGYNLKLLYFTDEELEQAIKKGLSEKEKQDFLRLRYLAYRIIQLDNKVCRITKTYSINKF